MADQEYYQFPYQAPPSTDILLHAADSSAPLYKCSVRELVQQNQTIPNSLSLQHGAGSPILSQAMNLSYFNTSTNLVLSSAQMLVYACLAGSENITGVWKDTSGAPSFTSGGFNGAGLYIANSSNTLDLVASTANSVSFWANSAFPGLIPFTSAYACTSPVVWLALYYNPLVVTTAPNLNCIQWLNSTGYNAPALPGSLRLQFVRNNVPTLLSNIAVSGTDVNNSKIFSCGLY